MTRLENGQLIHAGRYEILELIGQGGFYSIHKARDTLLDRIVTVKNPALPDERFMAELTHNEARVLAQCDHPGIVRLFDAVPVGPVLLNVVEYCPSSLESMMEKEPPHIDGTRVAEMLASVADALGYVHRRGFLHRNLKPRKILLGSTGHPRLSGFDLAVEPDHREPDGRIIGTPPFMAPEVIRGETLGPGTDIWAIGIILYEALCGERPYDMSFTELLQAASSMEPAPRPSTHDSSVPSGLEEICMRCLAKAPAERYPTAEQLADDLRNWLTLDPAPGTGNRVPRVFISHSSQDRETVERLIVEPLEQDGIETWYSKASIQTAKEWEASIRHGLESCDWFLLVMSENSSVSEWVKDELWWAIDERPDRIVPVLLDETPASAFHIRLNRIQYVDFRQDEAGAQRALVDALRAPKPE